MTSEVRNCPEISGFSIQNDKYVKILQYADDGILVLKNETEMTKALSIIEMLGSYLVLNYMLVSVKDCG